MAVSQVTFIRFSPTGSTDKVLTDLSLGFTLPPKHVNMTLPDNRRPLEFGSQDLVVMGFPVYGGRLPAPAEKIMGLLTSRGALFAGVVIYGNRAFEDALLELKDLAEGRGFVFVGGAACVAQHSMLEEAAQGRPDAADRAELLAFAKNLEAKVMEGIFTTMEVPGQKPYRKPVLNPPFAPEVNADCILCGACADVCAFGAIPPEAPDTTLIEPCKCCLACVRICPVNARSVTDERFAAAQKFIAVNALGERKDNLFVL